MLSDNKKKNPYTEWDISVYLLIFFALFWSTILGEKYQRGYFHPFLDLLPLLPWHYL